MNNILSPACRVWSRWTGTCYTDCRGSASERCAHYASSAIETLTECIVTLILQTGNVRLQSCEKLMGPVMHEDVQIDRV